MTQQISGVIFDLDGTLYYLKRIKVRLSFILWRTLPVLRHLNAARESVRGQTYANADELICAFCEALAQRAHISPEQAAAWYSNIFMSAFIDLLERRALPRPGLIRLLSRLRSAGIRLGIVTDFGMVEERLRAIGIPPEAFDDLLTTEDVGELKPSPRSLLTIARRWQSRPADIIVVGDRIDRDAEAAWAAGMDTLIIDNHAPHRGHRNHEGIALLRWSEATQALTSRTGLEL